MSRAPAVAGQFYPGEPGKLASMVRECLDPAASPQPALVAVCPHAGYIYSGDVAGKVLSRVEIPHRVLVLGPKHRPWGQPVAVMSRGSWLTPLGEVPLDPELGGALVKASPLIQEDDLAHREEHSLEVQVPFLQVLRPDFVLTPLCLSMLPYAQCEELGKAVAQAIRQVGEPVLMLASTDMTHRESARSAAAKDKLALDRILELDPEGLYSVVARHDISMCGVLPTTVALVAAKELGATSAELVAYTHSGQVTGDYDEVVAYAGLIIK